MKTIKPETVNFYWRKLCPDVVRDFTGFTTEPTKKITKETGYGKKKWKVKDFKIRILENSRADRHYTKGINKRQLDKHECFQTSA